LTFIWTLHTHRWPKGSKLSNAWPDFICDVSVTNQCTTAGEVSSLAETSPSVDLGGGIRRASSAMLPSEDEPAIEEALFIWKDTTADFADCLIGAKNRRLGCRATATFDLKASKLPGFIAA